MQPRRGEPTTGPAGRSGPADLSEAYAAVRWRAAVLRRRRLVGAVTAALVLAAGGLTAEVYFVGRGRSVPSAGQTTVYYSDGTTVMARLAGPDGDGPGGTGPDPAGTGAAGPTGLVVAHVLAELRGAAPFAGRPREHLVGGGFRIVTTVDAGAQALLERTADETVDGSVMSGQNGNLQAAAAVVEPGTGRVLAYYGGHDGTGPDYAAVPVDAPAGEAGLGAHPPAQTFGVYTLAAALAAGIAAGSVWDSPRTKPYPASGRGPDNPVRDFNRVACQPRCTLAEAVTSSLNVPLFGVAESLGSAAVLDVVAGAGITSLWLPGPVGGPQQRVNPADRTERARVGADIGAGGYSLTVLDHANGMATFAATGRRSEVHFVREVIKGGARVYREPLPAAGRPGLLSPAVAADLTAILSGNPAGRLPDGRSCAIATGEWPLAGSSVDTADAWAVGFTDDVAMAVWVGNEEFELPLRDPAGARISGADLPAGIFRAFMAAVPGLLGRAPSASGPPGHTGGGPTGGR